MKISYNWLKDFVDLPPDPHDLKSSLTRVGLGVESVSASDEDWVLEVEVTTNRPDCLNHYGIAREIAAAYRKPLKKMELILKESGPPSSTEVSIEVLNPELCARYCGRVLRHLRVGPSPRWLTRRLEVVGQRPINNLADATNYVLMELGHPLHAFDLARLRQREILVRRATEGESLRTLDGAERKLTKENLVIADAEHPVALAGVMGGADSAVSETTESVLLESAWFEPLSIRRTAKAQGMHTEASHRFERGADIEVAPRALDRCAQLILEIAGGEILRGMIDAYPRRWKREKLRLRRSEIRRILGSDVSWEEVERILRALGFQVERQGTESWGVTPPSFRLDVVREVDLIEEVARHFGYDRLPSRLFPAPPRIEFDVTREKEMVLSRTLFSLGYREIITSSMADPEENIRFSKLPSVVLQNPLSREASALRTTGLPSMLFALRWNLDRGQEDLRLFEMGKVYWQRPGQMPDEHRILTLGATGHRRAATVHEAAADLDFFDLKGVLEAVWEPFAPGRLCFRPADEAYYAKGFQGEYYAGESRLAVLGRLSPDLHLTYKLRQPVWLAEIDLERLLAFPLKSKLFRSYSKYPAVERDFSLLIPSQVTYEAIARAISGLSGQIASFRPLDLFRGGTLGSGNYSLLLRVTLQALDHTLTGDEIATTSSKILEALATLAVRLRE